MVLRPEFNKNFIYFFQIVIFFISKKKIFFFLDLLLLCIYLNRLNFWSSLSEYFFSLYLQQNLFDILLLSCHLFLTEQFLFCLNLNNFWSKKWLIAKYKNWEKTWSIIRLILWLLFFEKKEFISIIQLGLNEIPCINSAIYFP